MILVEKYGQAPWILQCMTAVQEAVQNSIEMLSGAPPQHNAMPIAQGGQYAFPARTAQELNATQDQAAVNGLVSPASPQQVQQLQQAEQAMAAGQVDMFAQLQRAAGMQDPASQGGAVQKQAEARSEPTSDEWII